MKMRTVGRTNGGRVRSCGWVCAAVLGVVRGVVSVSGAVYDVGPGQALTAIGAVPWEALEPGDEVRIHSRPEPYREKWVICRKGTALAPIAVRGIAGPGGALPVIEGIDATTRAALNYWNQPRGVVKIGGANVPQDTTPEHIVLENLEIRGARPPYSFRAADGSQQGYPNNAAAVYVEKGDHITVRGCVFRDCGNGLFVAAASQEILVEGCHVFDNGNEGSLYEHNSYTAARGITFQGNRYGPLRAGCLGNNLKDRSAGLVVRYNWIEGGNRQLDLVDGEDSAAIREHPLYHTTFVYGNVLIEPAGDGNRQIVHYGGDSGNTAMYRKGTLHFHHNTVVSTRIDRTTLFRLSTNEEHCDARNNLFYVAAGGDTLALVDADGVLALSHNWFKPGRRATFSTLTGTVNDDGTSLTGAAPGLLDEAAQDFRLARGSQCIDAGGALPAGAVDHPVLREYQRHLGIRNRRGDATADLGAFEHSPYAAWRFEQFGPGFEDLIEAADGADPEGDGLPNLLEYAFGGDPQVAESAVRPRPVTVLAPERHLGVLFERRPAPAEIRYTVQYSADLASWVDGSWFGDLAEEPGTEWTLWAGSSHPTVVRIAAPMSAASQGFLRIQVVRE